MRGRNASVFVALAGLALIQAEPTVESVPLFRLCYVFPSAYPLVVLP
jgi:hypothetical protein